MRIIAEDQYGNIISDMVVMAPRRSGDRTKEVDDQKAQDAIEGRTLFIRPSVKRSKGE